MSGQHRAYGGEGYLRARLRCWLVGHVIHRTRTGVWCHRCDHTARTATELP